MNSIHHSFLTDLGIIKDNFKYHIPFFYNFKKRKYINKNKFMRTNNVIQFLHGPIPMFLSFPLFLLYLIIY